MSDSVFDVNSIAAVIADAPCLPTQNVKSEHHTNCQAAAVVAWLDERLEQVGVLGETFDGHPYLRPGRQVSLEVPVFRIVIQPEDQHGR